MTNNLITKERLDKYFSITKEALDTARNALNGTKQALEFLDMAQRYYDDANYFAAKKMDFVLAFAALNYAHGWLDAGARSGLFLVNDSRLFTVDGNNL